MVLPAAVAEAAQAGNLAVVQAYLEADRNPDEAAADGTRLLWNACSINHDAPRSLATLELVKFLLARGASPDAWSRDPTELRARTALHAVLFRHAARDENVLKFATLLIDAGADPMLHDGDEGSPFQMLIQTCGHFEAGYELMVLFLRSGASRESLTTDEVITGMREQRKVYRSLDWTSTERVQKCFDLVDAVVAAGGTWRQYCLVPHKRLLRLRSLVARGRAWAGPETPAVVERILKPSLPNGVLWHILEHWSATR